MLSDAGREDGIAVDDFVQTFQNVLRLDQLARTIVVMRMILLQLVQIRPPRREVLGKSIARLEQVLQRSLCISDMSPRGRLHFAELGEIDIDMRNRLGLRSPFLWLAGNAIVEP